MYQPGFWICVATGITLSHSITYQDMNIRTWAIPVNGVDWRNETNHEQYLTTAPQGFSADKIAFVKAIVYSDAKPNNAGKEVFNLVRQSGYVGIHAKRKSGGWLRTFGFSSTQQYRFYLGMNRGLQDDNGELQPDDFFGADFPGIGSLRSFTDITQKRASVKVEYVCTATCPSPSTHVIWRKIGPWAMTVSKPATGISLASYGVPSLNIVDMNATIHSDPISGTSITVADLEHMGMNTSERKKYRGGIIWYGYGCATGGECNGGSFSQHRLNLFAGPPDGVIGDRYNPASSFLRGNYFENLGENTEVFNMPHVNPTQNRGWVRIEYTGTKSSVAIPYAMKTKAMEIGTWNMPVLKAKTFSFSSLGIAANRVTRLATTIRSDYFAEGQAGIPGYDYRNFHSTQSRSGTGLNGDPWEKGGGSTFIDESRNLLVLQSVTASPSSFFERPGYGYEGTGNRGFVLVDYLVGNCEYGAPSGTPFKIQGIPGTQVGDCAGTSQPFLIEGAGRGTPANTTTDSMTYVYRTANTANRTLTVKVDGQEDANLAGLAGVMFRSSLGVNSRNAATVTTHSGSSLGTYFRRRLTDGGQTQVSQNTAIKTPCWLRIKKVGNVFTAFYSTNPSETMPTSFTQLGSAQTISNFPSTYYVGLQVSNYTSPKLNRVTFRGYTETSP